MLREQGSRSTSQVEDSNLRRQGRPIGGLSGRTDSNCS